MQIPYYEYGLASKNKIRLTYATRGVEPMRAFPEFV